jgi:hypothetical protein
VKTLLILFGVLGLSGPVAGAEPQSEAPELDFLEFLGEFAGSDGDIEFPEADPQALDEASPEQRLERLKSAEPLTIEPATPVETRSAPKQEKTPVPPRASQPSVTQPDIAQPNIAEKVSS